MGIRAVKRVAVFLDRDGVINANVYNPATSAFESPHRPEDFQLHPDVLPAVRRLAAAGWPRFLVSNQPSYAKGKATLDAIRTIARQCDETFAAEGLPFTESFYCLHHPDGSVPGYSGPCNCRKPSPRFLLQAAERYGIDLSRSWMVGDRDSDVACGRAAGTRTILVASDYAGAPPARSVPDARAANLAAAVELILAAWQPLRAPE